MNTDIKEILEKMAINLGTTSEFLFSKLVKQAKINAIAGVLQIIFIAVAAIFLSKYIFWQVDIGLQYFGRVREFIIIYFILGIADLAVTLAFILVMYDRVYYLIDECIKCWFNPEGWVIEDILNRLD